MNIKQAIERAREMLPCAGIPSESIVRLDPDANEWGIYSGVEQIGSLCRDESGAWCVVTWVAGPHRATMW